MKSIKRKINKKEITKSFNLVSLSNNEMRNISGGDHYACQIINGELKLVLVKS